MPQRNDPETLKIPAYMRNKAIVKRDRQKLLWTAWDRKEAGVKPGSDKALGTTRNKKSSTPAGDILAARTGSARTGSARSESTRAGSSASSRKTARPTPNDLLKSRSATSSPDLGTSINAKMPYAGETTHYLDKINVAIIKTTVPLKQGDILLIEADNFIFSQLIEEMQIDRKNVTRAKKGSHIGLKVSHPAKVSGRVYRVG